MRVRRSLVYGSFMLQDWRVPESVSDDLPNTVWSLAVDLADTGGGPEPDEVHVYALVGRVGIEVLRLDTSGTPQLVPIDHIETPSGSGGISTQVHPQTGQKTLLLSERDCGLRAFRRP